MNFKCYQKNNRVMMLSYEQYGLHVTTDKESVRQEKGSIRAICSHKNHLQKGGIYPPG